MIYASPTQIELNSIAEFGCPFKVTATGEVITGVDLGHTDYFPESVMHEDNDDYSAELAPWEPVRGYTGQYGYNGPVMHPSEYLGGNMARDVLATPGLYVCITVEDGDDLEGDAVGWMLLRIEE